MPTSAEYPLLLGPLLDRGPRVQPETEIITKIAGGYMKSTYAEHRAHVSVLASALIRVGGVVEGDVVSTFCWNNARHYQLYHAVPCLGAIVNTLNIRLSDKELAWIISDAQTKILVVDEDLVTKMESVFAVEPNLVRCVERVIVSGLDGGRWTGKSSLTQAIDWEEFVAGANPADRESPWPELHEDAACFLCYTSGTTGNPKGVAYSHRSTYVHVLSQGAPDMMNIKGSDTILSVVPMFHAAGWAIPLVALTLGCRIVLVNRFMAPADVAKSIFETGVTLSAGVPSIWQMLRQALKNDPAMLAQVKGRLKTLIVAGSAPPQEMMMWFWKEVDVEFRHLWGMTEMNPVGTVSHFVQTQRDLLKTPEQRAENLRTQGLPFFCVDWEIANPDDLNKKIPHDGVQSGELLVKGPAVTSSYWKGVGADRFHNGFLKTGDVASISPTQYMQIRDRSKDLVKSGGEFISSQDLENTIMGMANVVTACVVAVPHPKWDERPVAIVVPVEGEKAPSRDEVCKFLENSNFAKFQLPDDILEWKEIPMTGTGKMDKKNVREKLRKENYTLPELRASKL